VADEPHDPPAARDDPSPARPLDYFAAHAPDAPTKPGLTIGWLVLALGWVPFICGIVNSQATARSGMPGVIAAHRNAAVLFSGLGVLVMIGGAVLFARSRDGLGFIVSIISVVVATGLATCLIGLR
jgi:hypothetical protein